MYIGIQFHLLVDSTCRPDGQTRSQMTPIDSAELVFTHCKRRQRADEQSSRHTGWHADADTVSD